jgi:hypothetical protein
LSGEVAVADYVLLYSGGKMPEGEAEQKAVMSEWEAWYGKIGAALVDGGNPFTPMSKTIASDGKVSDGPVGSPSSGYSVIKANSLDEAVQMAKGCPVLKGGAKVSVYQTFNPRGM